MINEQFKLKGSLEIKKNGELVQSIPNAVVNGGKDWVIKRMQTDNGTGAYAPMSAMAVGYKNWTGIDAVPPGEDSLASERGRVDLTADGNSITTPTIDGRLQLQFVATFPAGTGTAALTEAGVFNSTSASTGTMLCRTKFDTINQGANDTLEITWKIQVS